MTNFKIGDIVLYSPNRLARDIVVFGPSKLPDTESFGAIVASEPHIVNGALVYRLEGLDKTYDRGQTIEPEAPFDRLRIAPTYYTAFSKKWSVAAPVPHFDAFIHISEGRKTRWWWLASGGRGFEHDVDSYEAARAAVEERCK